MANGDLFNVGDFKFDVFKEYNNYCLYLSHYYKAKHVDIIIIPTESKPSGSKTAPERRKVLHLLHINNLLLVVLLNTQQSLCPLIILVSCVCAVLKVAGKNNRKIMSIKTIIYNKRVLKNIPPVFNYGS